MITFLIIGLGGEFPVSALKWFVLLDCVLILTLGFGITTYQILHK